MRFKKRTYSKKKFTKYYKRKSYPKRFSRGTPHVRKVSTGG